MSDDLGVIFDTPTSEEMLRMLRWWRLLTRDRRSAGFDDMPPSEPLPAGFLFVVEMVQDGGDDGDDVDPATWTYTLKRWKPGGGGEELVTGYDPVANGGVRRDIGPCTPATWGSATSYWDLESNSRKYWVQECNEIFPTEIGCVA